MSIPTNPEPVASDEEMEEIMVDVTEENMVWVHGEDWEFFFTPEEARQLGEALRDAAEDASTCCS